MTTLSEDLRENEKYIAILEAERINASDKYFKARPLFDSIKNRCVFEAGFDRGYKAAGKDKHKTISEIESAKSLNEVTTST